MPTFHGIDFEWDQTESKSLLLFYAYEDAPETVYGCLLSPEHYDEAMRKGWFVLGDRKAIPVTILA